MKTPFWHHKQKLSSWVNYRRAFYCGASHPDAACDVATDVPAPPRSAVWGTDQVLFIKPEQLIDLQYIPQNMYTILLLFVSLWSSTLAEFTFLWDVSTHILQGCFTVTGKIVWAIARLIIFEETTNVYIYAAWSHFINQSWNFS